MRRTIHAVAVGAAMMCFALPAAVSVAGVSDADGGGFLEETGAPVPIVDPRTAFAGSDGNDGDEQAQFVWTRDLSLTPPPYLMASDSSDLVPPSATATAIPLPAGVWTGFAGLAGIGTIAYLRHLRRAR